MVSLSLRRSLWTESGDHIRYMGMIAFSRGRALSLTSLSVSSLWFQDMPDYGTSFGSRSLDLTGKAMPMGARPVLPMARDDLWYTHTPSPPPRAPSVPSPTPTPRPRGACALSAPSALDMHMPRDISAIALVQACDGLQLSARHGVHPLSPVSRPRTPRDTAQAATA